MSFFGAIKDPWWDVWPEVPDSAAPREQLFEWAALVGMRSPQIRAGWLDDASRAVMRAYCEKWHPEMELPK